MRFRTVWCSYIEQKQKIVGSIFPERLIFEKNQFRTKKMNRVIQLITQNTKEKSKNKKDLALALSTKSDKVEIVGVEPTTLALRTPRSGQLSYIPKSTNLVRGRDEFTNVE